jgi:hypothetical protein
MITPARASLAASASLGLLLVASLVAVRAPAQAPAPTPAPAAAPAPDYHPSMGDLMTMAVQPRHIKLGLAGRRRNWVYAAYELSELRNALARVARTIPIYRTSDTAALVDAMARVPLDAVEQAIRNRDAAAFGAAYGRLTAACNACHQSQDHAMVVIRVPSGEAYPDQDFAPRQP